MANINEKQAEGYDVIAHDDISASDEQRTVSLPDEVEMLAEPVDDPPATINNLEHSLHDPRPDARSGEAPALPTIHVHVHMTDHQHHAGPTHHTSFERRQGRQASFTQNPSWSAAAYEAPRDAPSWWNETRSSILSASR
ncbi:MAG: hypothetical protein TREMPRED_001183 [Tremellales sp. Tagirdzhanova-0007]|nr:MAG: hypothetical protein TREMPRED_001183 [Tremellales sp. Tagirdzhanova-0007]